MKKLFILAAAAAMLAGCSETDELAQKSQLSEAADGRIDFSVYANRTTRAGKAGEINVDVLKQDDAGFGVFAYHTNNSKYDERTSVPNFMYNQPVKWKAVGESGVWEYSPVKYWPNEFGKNAVSDDIDYVSFFAYAPHVVVNPTTGIAEVDTTNFDAKAESFAAYLGYETVEKFREQEQYRDEADAKEALKMLYIKQQQGKNITSISRNADKGDPIVRYVIDTNPQTSVDLLWGVAADESFKGLANPEAVVKTGNCFIDLSKQIGTSDSIQWRFHHALAKLNVQIIAAADVVTEGVDPYEEPGTSAIAASDSTKIYLRSIDFTGFATRGALNLHSENVTVDYKLKPNWMNYDGTDLTASNVTFYDGLKDEKEGYTDNINTNEKPLGLNPVLLEKPTVTKWSAKQPGIPTDKYVNLFAGAKNAEDAIFVIPTNERMAITVIYDIMTSDSHLGQNLSDGFTKGSRVKNKISQTLKDLKLEAGKAYSIKLVVGIESVKIDVKVEPWDTTEAAKDVDLPYNPGEGGETPSPDPDPLTMEALTAGTIVVNNPKSGMQYSLNGGAKTPVTSDAINVSADDKVRFYGNGTSINNYEGTTIGGTAQTKVYGNIMSLIDETGYATLTTLLNQNYVFYGLFSWNSNLTDASGLLLPATTLAEGCYSSMFFGCTNLTAAPTLPATTLAESCYFNMFNGCTSLTAAPELPATTLANSCYGNMFYGCTSLTTAPALPATTLAGRCYAYMFSGCTSLTTAPALPAETLASGCYYYIFSGCTSLTTAPALPATTLAENCYSYMFKNCTNLTAAPTLPATTLASSCYKEMFYGCTGLTTAPTLPATTLANSCYGSMFYGCTSLTTAPATLPATTLAESCYNSMFYGCTSLTTAPTLPATTLVRQCYYEMFRGCSSLNNITCLATEGHNSNSSTTQWLNGVASTGTFTKASGTSWYRLASGIPSGWTVNEQ